ncbi:MAG: efflux RND transporter periplasmic adaptor subunit [Saprospiraceae bacterium]|nr:efflux RND transporter periplasmic adaptor subunit [Candidatus Vicinibacter proximus]MBL7823540.1 efflux RND transporter periplasmic adaptor subunit [Saprospiraceae bacterium]MCC6842706.1 efflux RND transporter periplasmic adaptor subunit [Saprospiraceae bacterium]
MKNLFFILASTTSIIFTSCNSNKNETHQEETEHHDEHENANTAMLTAEQMKSIKIELGSIEKKQLTASLKANGILKVPNQNKANATASLGGVIKTILVQTGNYIRKGQTIATISNNSFITMQEEYLSVSSKAELAQLEFARQKELQQGNAGALKNFQIADAELKTLKARKASLQKQLELIGIKTASLTSETIQPITNIISPINGTISNVMVNIGSYVDANNPIAEIVDNSKLHLDLYVYEKDLQKLKVGQTIHFTLTNNPGKEYDADVYAISNTFEPNTKAVAVHAMVKGNKQGLIDGMSITALVSLENATVDAVPTNAIVSHEGQDYIFIVTDAHKEVEHHSENETTEHKHDEHGHDEYGHDHTEKLEPQHSEEGTTFEKITIRKGTTDVGYSEITLLKEIPGRSQVVVNGAFFILAKMNNKGEGHAH